jgi:hypothetical protein
MSGWRTNLGLASLKAAMHVMLLMIPKTVSTVLPFNTVKWQTPRQVSSGMIRAFIPFAVKGLVEDVVKV